MPFAIQSAISAHVAERAAGLMPSGERPGEQVLAERPTLLPWYGPMIEASHAALFEQEVLPRVEAFAIVGARAAVVLDLGCGTGWYLRKLVSRFPDLQGIGLDGFADNIRHATDLAQAAGLSSRLRFELGDIYGYEQGEPVDLVAMSRALHHVWDERSKVFTRLRDAIKPGGYAVIWEPCWPADRAELRQPKRRAMAFQNLSEHVQGNHFLQPQEIEQAFLEVGMQSQTLLFADGAEAVIVAKRDT